MAKKKGFEVVVYDRDVQNKEKKIDTSITADIVADSYERMKPDRDEITLVAGDKDYVPVIEKLRPRGFTFHVAFWNHAAKELKQATTQFISLDPFLEHLNLNRPR